ncbi:MAG: hypothetical protein GF375_03250 [Candidatus Omnitrophica bacterium]|nr:hypothetical protein [Candidatus Omnitrophota bacterium]MBD3269099.1 hypothetical protein [Candidatus Omnitrophota bacterium]
MSENRRYIRISTVLPVEFFLYDKRGKRITPWLQGFTCDIGKGGICLQVNDLWWGFWDRLSQEGASLFLRVNYPLRNKTLTFKANIAWLRKEKLKDFTRYLIGLEFSGPGNQSSRSIFHYAVFRKILPIGAGALILFLICFSLFISWRSKVLVRQNRKLVSDYVSILERSSDLEEALGQEAERKEFVKKRQEELQGVIKSLEEQVPKWIEEYNSLMDEEAVGEIRGEQVKVLQAKIRNLESELAALKRENDFLKNQEEQRQAATLQIKEKVRGLQKEKIETSRKVIEGMYRWIKNRQDFVRGLVLSYEGDKSLDKVCFTYDQALAAIVFMVYGDNDRASKIFDFYLNRINEGENIYNAYFTDGGVFEYIIHSGPNAWLGLAVLIYTKNTGDRRYMPIADKVAGLLYGLMDEEGGVIGGPTVEWYSTEHNLDAYAFFKLFFELTGNSDYNRTAERIKTWLVHNAYTSRTPPVKRGKGDSTIATDTYTWSVAALRPRLLYELKMNPEVILDFAAKNCEVSVKFERREGSVNLRGFDFAKSKNMPRGGVVSGEWTSQMILSFEIMADYFKGRNPAKFKDYMEKAAFYFNELQKMLITSFSKVGREDPCLPYASSPFIDTGHGWRTPKGSETGSLASTAYFLLAYHGYNPLEGKFLEVSLKDFYERKEDNLQTFSEKVDLLFMAGDKERVSAPAF